MCVLQCFTKLQGFVRRAMASAPSPDGETEARWWIGSKGAFGCEGCSSFLLTNQKLRGFVEGQMGSINLSQQILLHPSLWFSGWAGPSVFVV